MRRFAPLLFLALSSPGAADVSERRTVIFEDRFSADPEQSPRWTVRRWQMEGVTREPDDPRLRPYHDPKEGIFYLTRQRWYIGVAAFANAELKCRTWQARFRFRVSGDGRLANGFIFAFYKKPVENHEAGSGSNLAFEGTPGYGLFFDTYASDQPQQRSVSIIKDSVYKTVGTKTRLPEICDQEWHRIQINFLQGRMRVQMDGKIVLEQSLQNVDYSNTGFGFTSAVGSALTDHIIDDFILER